jgi:predicted secreted Zn-dependent protease
MINSKIGKKLLANDKVLECIDGKKNNFNVALQNKLNFNKTLETWIVQFAAALLHPNGGRFPGQSAASIRENVKVVISQSRKTMVEPKAKLKRQVPLPQSKRKRKLRPRLR